MSREGLGALVGQLADGIGQLVSQHLQLARVELEEDGRRVASSLSRVALYLPFLVVGYGLLCTGASVWLSQYAGLAGGLCLVGAVNVIGATVGLARVRAALSERRVMGGTLDELQESVALLGPDNKGNGHGR